MTGAKYGVPKYGNNQTYGTGAYTNSADVTKIVQIDWFNTGAWPGDNEAAYMISYEIHRGKKNILAPVGGGFEQITPGTATLTMDNSTGRYTPHTSVALPWPAVMPGKFIRISVAYDDGAGGTTVKTRFTGIITDIRPVSGTENKVVITAADGLQRLSETDVTTLAPEFKRNLVTCIRDVLNLADWPARFGYGEMGTTVLQLGIFDLDHESALSAVLDLSDAGAGNIWCNKDGAFCFRNFDYYVEDETQKFDEDDVLKEIIVSQPWDAIRNDMRVYCNRVARLNTVSLIWQLPFVIEITGASDTIQADYPIAADVYYKASAMTANAAADGSGDDKTSLVTVVATCKANHAEILITNGTGGTVYITALELWGKRYGSEQMSWKNQDLTSQGLYGKRSFVHNNRFLQDYQRAKDIADYMVRNYASYELSPISVANPIITFQLEQNPDAGQFDLDLFDPCGFSSAKLGITTTNTWHKVIAIDETWEAGGGIFTTYTTAIPFYGGDSGVIDYYGSLTPAVYEREIITGSGKLPTFDWLDFTDGGGFDFGGFGGIGSGIGNISNWGNWGNLTSIFLKPHFSSYMTYSQDYIDLTPLWSALPQEHDFTLDTISHEYPSTWWSAASPYYIIFPETGVYVVSIHVETAPTWASGKKGTAWFWIYFKWSSSWDTDRWAQAFPATDDSSVDTNVDISRTFLYTATANQAIQVGANYTTSTGDAVSHFYYKMGLTIFKL